jgi:hypothetical protein
MRKKRSDPQRYVILAKGGYRCALTGEDIDPSADGFHIDHRTPLALGGSDADSNLQALAIAAHRQKTIADLKAIAKMKRKMVRFGGGGTPSVVAPGAQLLMEPLLFLAMCKLLAICVLCPRFAATCL